MNDEPNEAPRFIQLGRSIDSDLTPFEEIVLAGLSQLEPKRIGRLVAEALGRAEIQLDVVLLELGLDPDDPA